MARQDVKPNHMPKRVCHHCGQQLEIPDSQIGENFPCPACGKNIMAPLESIANREKIKLTVLPPPVENYSAAHISEIAKKIIANVQTVIVGKKPQVTLAVAGLFAEGHILFARTFRASRKQCCRAPSRRASTARSSASNARRICSRKNMSSAISSSTRRRAGRISVSARCSRKWFLWTKSTAPARARRPRCSRRWARG